jgi:hypothetical protein
MTFFPTTSCLTLLIFLSNGLSRERVFFSSFSALVPFRVDLLFFEEVGCLGEEKRGGEDGKEKKSERIEREGEKERKKESHACQ